jgi:proline iminopeptidase
MNGRINGTELFHTTHGHGPPMLVMHGGLGLDHTYLRSGLDPLGDAAELVYYDHRGNGRSSTPESWQAVSHTTWADDADALRARLGHERVLLFGHSYGAYLALEYALRHGDRLAGLVLCSAAPAMDYPEVMIANAQARGTPEQLKALLGGLSGPVASDGAFRQLWETILPFYFHDYRPEHGAAFAETRYAADAFNHAFFRCLPGYDVTDRLREITIPTLVLAGRGDWITPPAQGADRIHAALPVSERVVFEESGHFPFLEQPGEFIVAVRDWLARQDIHG